MGSVIPPKPAKRQGMPKLSIPSRPGSSTSGALAPPPPFGTFAGDADEGPSLAAMAASGSALYTPPQPVRAQVSNHSSSGSVNSLPGNESTSSASSPSHEWHLGTGTSAGAGSSLLSIPTGPTYATGASSTFSTNATVRPSAQAAAAAAADGAAQSHRHGGGPSAGLGGAGHDGAGGGSYVSSMYPGTISYASDYADPAALTNDLRRAISGLSLSSGRGSVDLDAERSHGYASNSLQRNGSADGNALFEHRSRTLSTPGSDAGGSDVGLSFNAGEGPSHDSAAFARGAGARTTSSTASVGYIDPGRRVSGSEEAATSRPGYPRRSSGRTDDGSSSGHHDDELILEGNLQVLCRLGEGASGEVVKALHRPTGLMMAKKSISTSPNPDIHRQILRELSFLRTCHSPYIVTYYGAFLEEEDTQIAICMEYCEGGSLEAIYKRVMARNGRTGEKVLAKVAECVLKGLEYLHNRNIIHRDIKPSNIVLTRNGQIKLCDLGVAGELVNSVAGTFTGTSYYMAPERIQGLPNYKINSDVWSLGLTLLEVASNRFPFPPEGEAPLGPFDLISYVIGMEIPQLQDDPAKGIKWSRPMRDFIQHTLEKDPAKRPGPVRMLQHPWIRRSQERQPQPDIGRFVAEVWGWDYPAGDGTRSPGEGQGVSLSSSRSLPMPSPPLPSASASSPTSTAPTSQGGADGAS